MASSIPSGGNGSVPYTYFAASSTNNHRKRKADKMLEKKAVNLNPAIGGTARSSGPSARLATLSISALALKPSTTEPSSDEKRIFRAIKRQRKETPDVPSTPPTKKDETAVDHKFKGAALEDTISSTVSIFQGQFPTTTTITTTSTQTTSQRQTVGEEEEEEEDKLPNHSFVRESTFMDTSRLLSPCVSSITSSASSELGAEKTFGKAIEWPLSRNTGLSEPVNLWLSSSKIAEPSVQSGALLNVTGFLHRIPSPCSTPSPSMLDSTSCGSKTAAEQRPLTTPTLTKRDDEIELEKLLSGMQFLSVTEMVTPEDDGEGGPSEIPD